MLKPKIFVILCIMLLCTHVLLADDQITPPRFSAFYGLSLATQTVDGDSNADRRLGLLNVGISYLYELPNKLVLIEPGLRLSNKGYKYQDDESGNLLYLDLFGKLKLNTLSFPLYPYAGMYAGYLLKAEEKLDLGKFDLEGFEDIPISMLLDLKEQYKSMDLGFLFGADIVIENRVTLGFEYNFGVLSVDDLDGNDFKVKNNSMLMTIGVLF